MGIDNVRNHQPIEASTLGSVPTQVNGLVLVNAAHVDAIADNILSNPDMMPNFDDDDDLFMSANQEMELGELKVAVGDAVEEMGVAKANIAARKESESVRDEAEGVELKNVSMEELLRSGDAMTHVRVVHYEDGAIVLKHAHEVRQDVLEAKLKNFDFVIVKGKELHHHHKGRFVDESSIKVMMDGIERQFTVKHLSAKDAMRFESILAKYIEVQTTQPTPIVHQEEHKDVRLEHRTVYKDRTPTIVVLAGSGRVQQREEKKVEGEKAAKERSASVDQVNLAQDEAKFVEERKLKRDEIAITRLLFVIVRDIEHRLVANANLALENCKRDHSFVEITHEQIARHQAGISVKS